MITYIDEIIILLLTLSIGLVVFSWRRWLELKKETTERIRLQEERIKVAETKEETERIFLAEFNALLKKYNATLEAGDYYPGYPESGQDIRMKIEIPSECDGASVRERIEIDLGRAFYPTP